MYRGGGPRLLIWALLPQPIGTFRQRADAVEAFSSGDIEYLFARTSEGDVGALARRLDHAEICPFGIEHLDASDGGDVDAILTVDREAIGSAFRTRRDIAQLRECALIGY